MNRKKIENLQKCCKRKFLDNNDSENETLSADHREQNENNNDRDDDFEEHAIVNFELGETKRGGVCIWFNGFRFTHTVAMGSDNALSCMMRRQKKKILGNVDCADPLAFTIPDKLRIKNGEDIVLYDSRTVRIGEKDVVLVFGSERTLDILSKNSATWHLDGTFKAAPNCGSSALLWARLSTTECALDYGSSARETSTLLRGSVELSTLGDETTQDETTQDETTRDETTRDETTRDETTQDETTRDETTRDETTRDETTRDEMTGSDAEFCHFK
ncbi:hypothetical protein niasHT_019365 [Heterodera trifolii]|uniref:Uncharacterized protein n=1 Tax=Heterodera trifolii TaxID=157864 RepID=A0ABD2L5R6_9BILA